MVPVNVVAEENLVRRLQKGEISAFNAIYWQYHAAIYRNILKFTKDEDAAADLLQDVFTKFWEKRESLNPEKPISGLLFVISYHLSVNYMKRRITELLVRKDLSLQLPPREGELELLENQYQLLEAAIATLTPQKQTIFTRCKLEGKSYEEVAEELHISKNTVKEHLSIAMKSVKAYISQQPDLLLVTGMALFLECWYK